MSLWNATKNDPIAKETKWTEEDEGELNRLEAEDIELCHTEVGRQIDSVLHNTIAAITKMSDKQIKKLKDAIPNIRVNLHSIIKYFLLDTHVHQLDQEYHLSISLTFRLTFL